VGGGTQAHREIGKLHVVLTIAWHFGHEDLVYSKLIAQNICEKAWKKLYIPFEYEKNTLTANRGKAA
jgi:hypothetical protein